MDCPGEDYCLSLTDTTISIGALSGFLDTTTLAAHDFDVDTRTGFLPPQAPLSRLPTAWEEWEESLENAVLSRLQLGDKPDLRQSEKDTSRRWRDRVRKVRNFLTFETELTNQILSPASYSSYNRPNKVRSTTPARTSCLSMDHALLHPHPSS